MSSIASGAHCKHLPRMTPGFRPGLVIPDLWQQEAVRALQQGKDVVVQAPTGSGKTYIFELLYPNLKTQAVFTVPTRALLLQFTSLFLNNGRRSSCPTIQWLQPCIVSRLRCDIFSSSSKVIARCGRRS